MALPQSAEIASLRVASAWSKELRAPAVRPGSIEEREAIRMMDERRDAELSRRDDSPAARRKRARRKRPSSVRYTSPREYDIYAG